MGLLLRTLLMTGLLAAPAAAQVTSVEALRSALPGANFLAEPFSPAFAEYILTNYADSREQSPKTLARMVAAFEGRFQGGTALQGIVPGPIRLNITALISPQGDLVVQFLIPVENSEGLRADAEGAESDVRSHLQSIEAITGVSVGQSPSLIIQQVLGADNFVRFPGQGDQAVYARATASDRMEFTYSSLGDEACPFMAVEGWLERQTCP